MRGSGSVGAADDNAHTAVLVEEALAALPSKWWILCRCDIRARGHTARLLEAVGSRGSRARDRPGSASHSGGRARFADEMRLALVHASFAELGRSCRILTAARAAGVLPRSRRCPRRKLDDASRGFVSVPTVSRYAYGTRHVANRLWLVRSGASDEIREVNRDLGETPSPRRAGSDWPRAANADRAHRELSAWCACGAHRASLENIPRPVLFRRCASS